AFGCGGASARPSPAANAASSRAIPGCVRRRRRVMAASAGGGGANGVALIVGRRCPAGKPRDEDGLHALYGRRGSSGSRTGSPPTPAPTAPQDQHINTGDHVFDRHPEEAKP